jgi:hypothetical protein
MRSSQTSEPGSISQDAAVRYDLAAMRDELTVKLNEDDFIEAYRPVPRSRRHATLALLLAVMLAFVIIGLVVSVPEARWAFTQSRLLIGLTGAAVFAAALVTGLLLAAPALRRRAARSSLNDHPGMRDPVGFPSTQTISP